MAEGGAPAGAREAEVVEVEEAGARAFRSRAWRRALEVRERKPVARARAAARPGPDCPGGWARCDERRPDWCASCADDRREAACGEPEVPARKPEAAVGPPVVPGPAGAEAAEVSVVVSVARVAVSVVRAWVGGAEGGAWVVGPAGHGLAAWERGARDGQRTRS